MYIFIVYFILKDISLHHVRYKSKNNEKENMKEEKIPCRIIRYRSSPICFSERYGKTDRSISTRHASSRPKEMHAGIMSVISVSLSITGQRRWQTPTE